MQVFNIYKYKNILININRYNKKRLKQANDIFIKKDQKKYFFITPPDFLVLFVAILLEFQSFLCNQHI